MSKKFILIASLFALLAVALGAFAAHGLQSLIDAAKIKSFQTGVRYQFYHSFALFIVAILMQNNKSKLLSYAAWSFIIGMLFFSGSIYLLSCREILGIESWKWLGPITPLGGLLFMGGWACVFFAYLSENSKSL